MSAGGAHSCAAGFHSRDDGDHSDASWSNSATLPMERDRPSRLKRARGRTPATGIEHISVRIDRGDEAPKIPSQPFHDIAPARLGFTS